MPALAENYSGKVVLVTGAGSGIGRATALAFAREGAWVAVSDINENDGIKTVGMILEDGGEAIFFPCDVSDPDSVKNLMEHVEKRMGGISSAFNNAGIEGQQAMVTDCTLENWNHVINVNLRSIWLCMKYQITGMIKNGGGSIVNCSSIAGLVGFQSIPAYVASKHGVIGLTKNAALEYAHHNIRVNAICPGVIHTPMIDRFTGGDAAALEQLQKSTPMGRIGTPDEIASAVVWLCSGQASFVTGHALVADGGWLAQ